MVAAVNFIFVSLLQISCTEQLLEVANDESIEDYTLHFHLDSIPPDDLFTLGKMHHFGASFHRILSCSAAEKLLIAVRGVNYLHFTQVVSTPKTCELCLLVCNRTTQYPSAVFPHGEILYIARNYHSVNWSGRIYLCINHCFEVLTLWVSGWGGGKDVTTYLLEN